MSEKDKEREKQPQPVPQPREGSDPTPADEQPPQDEPGDGVQPHGDGKP